MKESKGGESIWWKWEGGVQEPWNAEAHTKTAQRVLERSSSQGKGETVLNDITKRLRGMSRHPQKDRNLLDKKKKEEGKEGGVKKMVRAGTWGAARGGGGEKKVGSQVLCEETRGGGRGGNQRVDQIAPFGGRRETNP